MDRDPTAYTGDSEAPVAVMVAGDTAAPRTAPPVNANGAAWTLCRTNEEKARCPLRDLYPAYRPARPHFAICANGETHQGLCRRNASLFLQASQCPPRPDDGPGVDLAHRSLDWCEFGG